MLDITVKTMDSQSRSFQVPESMSVGDFKRRICDSVNIAVDSQRLIFQGRVLGDTMKLTSDHHEKTLHLVQRAQSSTSSAATGAAAATTSSTTTNSGTSRPTTTSAPPPHPHLMPTLDILNQMFAGQGMFAGTPVIGRVHHQGTSTAADGSMNIEINLEDPRSFTQQPPSTSQHQHSRRAAADSRVNFERMWRTLQLLTNIADTHSSTTNATTTTATGSENNEQTSSSESVTSDETGNTSTTTTDSTTAQDNSRLASGGTSNIHSQNSRPRLRQPLVSELRDFYSQFTQVQGRLQPMFNQYQRFLQDDPAFTSTNSREYQDSCGFFQLVPQVLRYMADIYDFLANISIPLERVPPRPVMMTNNSTGSRSRRSSNRAPSGGITLGQMVRGHQHQTTTPPPSGGISSTQRTSTNTATGRRRFCMHQPGRSGSAAASATGSSGGSPTTTQRRSNRPSTTGATSTSSSSGNTQQSATSTTQQRTLPPYAFQINTIFYQRATQLPSSSSSTSGDSGQQTTSATTTSATTTSATTTSATNETTISNQQEQDSTNVTATSSLSSTQQGQQGVGEQQGGEQQGVEERKRKNPTLPDSSDVSSNKKSK